MAKKMLERMNESHHNVTGWALSLWEIQGNDNILDIGCGGGAALSRMAEHVTDGHLTGIDYSPVSVETSRATNAESVAAGKDGNSGRIGGKASLRGRNL